MCNILAWQIYCENLNVHSFLGSASVLRSSHWAKTGLQRDKKLVTVTHRPKTYIRVVEQTFYRVICCFSQQRQEAHTIVAKTVCPSLSFKVRLSPTAASSIRETQRCSFRDPHCLVKALVIQTLCCIFIRLASNEKLVFSKPGLR